MQTSLTALDYLREIRPVLVPLAILGFCVFFTVIFRKPIAGFLDRLTGLVFRHKTQDAETQIQLSTAWASGSSLSISEAQVPREHVPVEGNGADALEFIPSTEIGNLIDLFSRGKYDEAETAFGSRTGQIIDSSTKLIYESFYCFFRYTYGVDKSLESQLALLRRASGIRVVERTVNYHLALSHSQFGRNREAIPFFLTAMSFEARPLSKVTFLSQAAKCYSKMGAHSEALDLLLSALGSSETPEASAKILASLSTALESAGLNQFAFLANLATLVHVPNDPQMLFKIAYASTSSFVRLNLYQELLSIEPSNDTAMNNLGASLGSMDIKMESVAKLKAAKDMGNTLAAANLANSLRHAGFSDDARHLLTWAQAQESPHEAVSEAVTKLNKAMEDEEKQIAELEKVSDKLMAFTMRLSKAVFSAKPTEELRGQWKCSSPEVSVILSLHTNQGPAEIMHGNACQYVAVLYYGSSAYDATPLFISNGSIFVAELHTDVSLLKGMTISCQAIYDPETLKMELTLHQSETKLEFAILTKEGS
jgi:tetratricopeptide (TPR) repeat protein